LGLPEPARAARAGAALILEGQPPRAFFVDAVLGEQELVVKPLGPAARAEAVAGAALLANGETALVLDLQAGRGLPRGAGPDREAEPERPGKVLVVEDSITSRTLIKSLLETAGYAVSIAVDGASGWDALQAEDFDAVVSDVEMPRMDGFELLARIRADERLRALPVALVTSLDSEGERARGLALGANAYMAKGEFDARRLLEIMRGAP
jgi:two-component system chemotaxis sensor kinase CheA